MKWYGRVVLIILSYLTIGTVLMLISKENEDVFLWLFGGLVGLFLYIVLGIVKEIKRKLKR